MSMRSLMFGWEYPPIHLGGLGVACQGLVRGLLRNGVEITLVLPHPNPQAAQELEIIAPSPEELERIIIHSSLRPYDSVELYAERIKAIANREENQMYGQDLAQEIENYTDISVDLTKHVNTDVIHCHDWMTYEAGIRASKYHQKPLVTHIHATELDRTHFQPNPWIYEKEKIGFIKADKIIAVSHYTKGILIKHYGINPEKICVVHNGNHKTTAELGGAIRAQYRQKRGPMILFLGRLTVQKGPNQFLDMAAQVHKYRPDVHFVMAGDGHMLGELIHRTHQLGLQNCVIFAGKVSNAEAQKLFAQADCFVMPSLSEPFGLVALEAVAEGTPVVLSNQSGVGEVISHAMKVDFWDTAKMADCVLTILRENALGSQLRSEASHILKTLTWENQARNVKSIYQKLLDHS